MNKIKKGSIVVRKSHNQDILFKVIRIIKTNADIIAVLQGVFERIEVDSPISDLELIERKVVNRELASFNQKINLKLNSSFFSNRLLKEKKITGRILHLDGDRKYAIKSYSYYKKLGLHAIVKNISEYKQPKLVYSLLKNYTPDILVVTRTRWYD